MTYLFRLFPYYYDSKHFGSYTLYIAFQEVTLMIWLQVFVQSPSYVRLIATPWTVACQAATSPPSLPKLMSIDWIGAVIQASHALSPLLLLPSFFPSISVFSSELAVRIRWPKYWSFSFSISPLKEYSGLICFTIDWFDLLNFQGTLQESSPAAQFESINSSMLCLLNKSMPAKLLKYQIYGSLL